jgi:hypothetical protein
MDTSCPHPGRLAELSLFHDGERPLAARRLALAASPDGLRRAALAAEARFFESLFQKGRESLAGLRARERDPLRDTALARLEGHLARLRHEGARHLTDL